MSNEFRLPDEGFVRERLLLGDPDAVPPVPAVIPVSHTAWWTGVRTGRYPPPVKLSPKVTVWRVDDIRRLIKTGKFSANPGKQKLAPPVSRAAPRLNKKVR